MRRNHFLLLYIALAVLAPHVSSAATITFDPQENTVGTRSTFIVAVNVDAEPAINALSLALAFSENFEVVDVSDGNSVMSVWLDKPHYDSRTHTLTFSGLFPGGYSGTGGRLATLTVRATRPGVGGIRVVRPSVAYLNTPTPTEDTLESHTLSLEATDTKDNLSNTLLDVRPPEAFAPSIALIPSSDSTDAWALIFSTTDKGSGVDRVEISETNPLMPWEEVWHPAESPYILQDQTLSSRITIRVYDKKGNVRAESILAKNAQSTLLWASIALGAGIIGVLLWLLRRKR